MTNRRQWRQYKRLAEQGRRLATAREDLIAAGADPDELPVPLYPVPPLGPDPDTAPTAHARELAAVWLIVAVACLGAFAGCVSAVGAMLVINQAPTWHAWVAVAGAVGWFCGMIAAAVHAGRVRRNALEATSG